MASKTFIGSVRVFDAWNDGIWTMLNVVEQTPSSLLVVWQSVKRVGKAYPVADSNGLTVCDEWLWKNVSDDIKIWAGK